MVDDEGRYQRRARFEKPEKNPVPKPGDALTSQLDEMRGLTNVSCLPRVIIDGGAFEISL